MSVQTYRPKAVTVVFNGIPIEGFAEGTFIEAEKNEDAFALSVGSTGSGARAQTHDESGTVTVTLQQTSLTNAALSAMHKLDKAGGDGVGPLRVRDLSSGTELVAAETAWIRKVPNMGYSNDISPREWVFETDNLEMNPGGTA